MQTALDMMSLRTLAFTVFTLPRDLPMPFLSSSRSSKNHPAATSLFAIAGLCLLMTMIACGDSDAGEADAATLPDLARVEPEVKSFIEERLAEVRSTKSSDSWRKYGRALHAHGFSKSASQAYLEAAKKVANPMPDFYLAGVALLDEDPEKALKHLERARKSNPRFLAVHLRLGLLYMDAGRYDDALEAFEAANRIAPTADGLGGRARALLNLDRIGEAREAINSAIASDRRNPQHYGVLAQIESKQGRNAAADRAQVLARDTSVPPKSFPDPLMAAVLLESRSFRNITGRIEGLLSAGRPAEALQSVEELIRRRPKAVGPRRLKADILLRMKRYAESDNLLFNLLQEAPDDVETLLSKASISIELRKESVAIDYLNRVLKIESGNVKARYLLGFLLGPNDAESGIEHLEAALEGAPLAHAPARILIARLHDSQGRKKEAQRWLREALLFDPNDQDAQRMMKEL